MKRTEPDPDGSDVDQQHTLRDYFKYRLNALLSDKRNRQRSLIIPAAYFSRLVAANREHMLWDHPEKVFDQAPGSRVTMDKKDFFEWAASVDGAIPAKNPTTTRPYPLKKLYTELFWDGVEYVEWQTFTTRFLAVVDDTVREIKARQRRDPRRITLLVLDNMATKKSNAWLTGFAWQKLAPIVDYVVSDNNSTAIVFDAVEGPLCDHPTFRQGLVDKMMETASSFFKLFQSTDNAEVRETLSGFDEFLKTFEIDIIYVDDMVYSGCQASSAMVYRYSENRASTMTSRAHVHIVAPYIAEEGRNFLTNCVSGHVADLRFAPSMVKVAGWNTKVEPIFRHLERYWRPETHPQLSTMIAQIRDQYLPTIVFEHKLADSVSLPSFLAHGSDEFGIGLPELASSTIPFYKFPAFSWRKEHASNSRIIEKFTDIDTLFRALHREWEASPPCASCGKPADFRCTHCEIMPYCSMYCRAHHPAALLDRHEEYCHRLAALGDGHGQNSVFILF